MTTPQKDITDQLFGYYSDSWAKNTGKVAVHRNLRGGEIRVTHTRYMTRPEDARPLGPIGAYIRTIPYNVPRY